VARTAEVGDDLGSAVTAGRQVRELMRLALLLGRRYAPYQKWLGTAFARLPHTDTLPALLFRATTATDSDARQDALASAYVALAERHNQAGLTDPVPATVRDYHSRPAQVLPADRFTDALLATVQDGDLRRLPLIGAVDQHTDSTDVLQDPAVFCRTSAVHREVIGPPDRPRFGTGRAAIRLTRGETIPAARTTAAEILIQRTRTS
jgi:hypothetical protein